MSVCYQKPDDPHYARWCDEDGTCHDVWYERGKIIPINGENDAALPLSLLSFIKKWRRTICERYDTFRENYPVRDTHIEFIFEGEVYNLTPAGVHAMYKDPIYHMGIELRLEFHALFEDCCHDMIKDLQESLGVIQARYFGYLD